LTTARGITTAPGISTRTAIATQAGIITTGMAMAIIEAWATLRVERRKLRMPSKFPMTEHEISQTYYEDVNLEEISVPPMAAQEIEEKNEEEMKNAKDYELYLF